jgi:WD40 repeat protein
LVRIPGARAPQFSADGRRLAIWTPAGRAILDVNPGQPYRSLHHGKGVGTSVFPAVSPDGRLLVTASADGVRITDLAAGAEVGRLEIGVAYSVHFDPAGDYLFTGGRAGLHRWRLTPSDEPGRHGLRVDRPEALRPGASHAVPSRDGKTRLLVWDRGQHAVVLDAETQAVKARLTCPVQMFYPAVSPDGRWVATGTSEHGAGVQVWDVQTGQVVHRLPNPGLGGSRTAFSPDGRWLVASGGQGYLCLEVGSWQERWRQALRGWGWLTPPVAFAPGGRVLAVASTPRDVALVDPATGREYCTLAAPTPQFLHQLCFSPDGSQLVASNDRSQALPVWDLRRIRAELAAIGLDWDLSPYPPATSGDGERVRVEVDHTGLRAVFQAQEHFARGLANARAKKWPEAIAAYSKGLALAPGDPLALNNLAWYLATCPDPKLRDTARAVTLARKAVELAPQQGGYWNTLGAAHYRAGDGKAAVEALEKALKLQGDNGFDFFFLAMAHGQMGRADEARRWFDRGVAWMDRHAREDEELRRFRAEAADLLGVKDKD